MYLHANAKLGLAGRLALVRPIEERCPLKQAAATSAKFMSRDIRRSVRPPAPTFAAMTDHSQPLAQAPARPVNALPQRGALIRRASKNRDWRFAMPRRQYRVRVTAERTNESFVDAVPHLLAERGMSQRQLARAAQVDAAHISRALRRKNYSSPSADLARRVALALGLPADYFPEYRRGVVSKTLNQDLEYLNRVYDDLVAASS